MSRLSPPLLRFAERTCLHGFAYTAAVAEYGLALRWLWGFICLLGLMFSTWVIAEAFALWKRTAIAIT